VRSMPADGLDLERLGLEPNPVRISLGGQTLRFGGTEPIDGLRYVGAGDLVHLIEDRFHHLLTAAASDYVDPHPLPAGLVPVSGDIAGTAIAPPTLAAIAAVKAERVEPMGGELAGQILRIQPVGEGAALRFLVSADGLRWSRPDLRLTYLVASPPPALVDQGAAGPAESPVQVAAPTHTQDSGALPEQAVGVVQGVAPVLTDGQPAPAGGEAVPGQGEAAVAGAVDAGEPGGEQWAEPIVDPNAPMEIRVERLAPTDGALRGQNPGLDPLEARQREIDDAVSASFGGPPVRSQAQIQREEEGIVDGDAIVSPEEAAGPPPQVKLRPE
jgi:hypothetical protein